MANKIIKVCDKCKKEVTYTNDLKAREVGWTILSMNFGEIVNGCSNPRLTMDLCPECAEELNMIKMKEYNNKAYVARPNNYSKEDVSSNDILENIKDFIREIGEEEGWYSE